VVASGSLPECGEYCVEEEDDEEDGGPGAVLRRLVFLRNQHVIQSEIRLKPPPALRRPKQKSGKGGKKGKAAAKSKAAAKAKAAAAAAAAAAAEAAEEEEEGGGEAQLSVDWSYLCFDYHRAILAGLIGLLYPRLKAAHRNSSSSFSSSSAAAAAEPKPKPRCLVIGLGGGGLPLFLRRYVPCLDVTVVELEAGLGAVAESWFGFRPDDGLRVEAGDGVRRVVEGGGDGNGSGEAWDAIVVDVDNKDASLGISCPAPAFLTPEFLAACRLRLTPEGLLAVNVAARSPELLGGALDAVARAFVSGGGELYTVHPTEQDVNRVVFALREPRPAAGKASLRVLTERWLEETAAAGGGGARGGGQREPEDPLELGEISRRITKRA
jgi:hypothetical protein